MLIANHMSGNRLGFFMRCQTFEIASARLFVCLLISHGHLIMGINLMVIGCLHANVLQVITLHF